MKKLEKPIRIELKEGLIDGRDYAGTIYIKRPTPEKKLMFKINKDNHGWYFTVGDVDDFYSFPMIKDWRGAISTLFINNVISTSQYEDILKIMIKYEKENNEAN